MPFVAYAACVMSAPIVFAGGTNVSLEHEQETVICCLPAREAGVIPNGCCEDQRSPMPGLRKLSLATVIAAALLVMTQSAAADTSPVDGEVRAALRAAVEAAADTSAGALFGVLDSLGVEPHIWAEGAVDAGDELRLGCPTGKPILAYLALRGHVPLSARIARWFPEEKGFTRSSDISVQHLMLNSSGIRDYVPMLTLHPDSAITVDTTIDRAYRGQALLFDPGNGFEYSNTNFNLLGRLLEIETGRGIESLVRASFAPVAPTLRYDDGRGRYPRGYARPWPYHWSCPGYGGGLIGTAADAMRAFAWIAAQPEFQQMTRWSEPDGSPAQSNSDHLLGLGVFGRRNLAGCGEAAFYDGDVGPCQMILARVRGRVFYIATTHRMGLAPLNELFAGLVAGVAKAGAE